MVTYNSAAAALHRSSGLLVLRACSSMATIFSQIVALAPLAQCSHCTAHMWLPCDLQGDVQIAPCMTEHEAMALCSLWSFEPGVPACEWPAL